ncbi:hypothetical protein CBS14141_002876 [Malassezia furfur]|nr:hypothetical protein CBS14141_002876 [Malassezia furfur]
MVVPRVGPNFPAALAIAPSAPARDGACGGDAWEHDSADDIAAFGIAGRIWESAFLLRRAGAGAGRARVCTAVGDARAADAAVRAAPRPLTHILCSDLVYFPELLAPLLRTLLDLTSTAQPPEVVIGYRIRSLTKEQPFWAALGSWFDFRAVYCAPKARPDAWVPFGSDATHLSHGPPGAVADDYFVFVAHRKPHTLSQTAPHSDAALLAGRRVTDAASQTYDPDLSGVDTFEWLMLSRST